MKLLNVTFLEDFGRTQLLCESIRQNVLNPVELDVIINDDAEHLDFIQYALKDYDFVNVLHYSELPRTNWIGHDIPPRIKMINGEFADQSGWRPEDTGWYSQQFLKMAYAEYCGEDYFIFDSKTFVNNKVDLRELGRWGGSQCGTERPETLQYAQELGKPPVTNLMGISGVPFYVPTEAFEGYNFDNLFNDLFAIDYKIQNKKINGQKIDVELIYCKHVPYEYSMLAVLVGDEFIENNYVDKKGVVLGADKIDKKLSDSNFIFIPHNTEEDIVRRTWKHLQRKGFPVMLEDAEIRGNKSKLIVVDKSSY